MDFPCAKWSAEAHIRVQTHKCTFSLQKSSRVPAYLSDEIKPPAVVLTLLPSCKDGQPGSSDLESIESSGFQ